jgi:ATP-dependent exoDNAse (exonuclease V) alpha subunit
MLYYNGHHTYKKSLIQIDIQCPIRQIVSTSKIQILTPVLKLYKGTKVMITKNLSLKLGIVNGTIGNIQNISVNES